MRVEQSSWSKSSGWDRAPGRTQGFDPQLVLAFGSGSAFSDAAAWQTLRSAYPGSRLVGCSTAGEIAGTCVQDETLVATALRFDHTAIACAAVRVTDAAHSYAAGTDLAAALPPENLAHVVVLSEGLKINGSELVRGLAGRLPAGTTVTGGLSADGARFERTLVCLDGEPLEGQVVAIGFYGERLRVGCASMGGWDTFGPERIVTRSSGNVLYELDGAPALDLYRKYLGDAARDLPASGLLFPLCVRSRRDQTGVVRTILGIDESARSLTFAGDIEQGSFARLMKANFDRLIDGATGAARKCQDSVGAHEPELALLISCVGRKLVLKHRIEEEVEGVRGVLGPRATLLGFYSYGEISPFTPLARCELHNQTMTITTLREA